MAVMRDLTNFPNNKLINFKKLFQNFKVYSSGKNIPEKGYILS